MSALTVVSAAPSFARQARAKPLARRRGGSKSRAARLRVFSRKSPADVMREAAEAAVAMYVNKFTPDSLPRSIDTAVHGSWDESSAYQVHESSDVIWAKMSELEKLSAFSAGVHDAKGAAGEGCIGETAATVTAGVLMTALKQNTGDVGALEGAMVYEACDLEHCDTEDARLACVIDKAFVNLGAMMATRVDGKVSVEVDVSVHAARDAAAVVDKARRMRAMFDELKVPHDKILYKIPCTWQGVQAVGILESEGIACHVTHVYCLEQAAATARAGASLMQVYVGRVRTWYAKHPEATAENNLYMAADPGVELARQTAALIKKEKCKAKVIAASIRGRDDARALAGCDYLLLNDRVIEDLSNNWGDVEDAFEDATCPDVGEVSEAIFEAALKGSPGAEELALGLSCCTAAEDKLKEFIKEKVMPGAGQ